LRRAATGLVAALLPVVCVPASPALAAKTDVVVLRNGDRLTGEVKQLDRGSLMLKTDDIGTIAVEWDKVASVTASATFEVEDLDGGQYIGSLTAGPQEGELGIVAAGGLRGLALWRVVRIQRLGATLWQRLDGSLDVGASYTSSSELLKIDLAARVILTRAGHRFGIDGSSTMTQQADVEDTRRNNLTVSYGRRYPNRWVGFAQAQVEQNRELGYDVRGSVSAGGGRYLVQDRRQDLLGGMGLRLNREKPLEGESNTHLEAAATLVFDRFSYDFPKVDVYVTLSGFASLTDWGRVRVELDARWKRELLNDFALSVRGYESYDSRPATEGAERNDYGLTFGLAWTF
jgi:hypothetical protein